MKTAALLVSAFVFFGCVSTETFNKTVAGLKAEFKTENTALCGKVRQLEEKKQSLFRSFVGAG